MQFVSGAVGGVIGFFIGGPAGAAIGFSIGMGIGMTFETIDAPGAKLGEISNTTSDEGGPRVIPFGVVRPIGGQLMGLSSPNVVTTTVEQGGKGGPSITTSYDTVYRTYAIGVCEGPITSYRRIWRNNELVYDNREGSAWGAANNAAFLNKATLYLGDYDQEPDAALESIYGSGNVPGHRGTAFIVVEDEDVTDVGGAVPQYLFEVDNYIEPHIYEDWYVYAVSLGGGIYRTFNGAGGFSPAPVQKPYLANEQVWGMAIEPVTKDLYLVGFVYGVRRVLRKQSPAGTGTWSEFTLPGSPTGNALCIVCDRNKNSPYYRYIYLFQAGKDIWVLRPGDTEFAPRGVVVDPTMGIPLSQMQMYSATTAADGTIYFANYNSGLGIYKVAGGTGGSTIYRVFYQSPYFYSMAAFDVNDDLYIGWEGGAVPATISKSENYGTTFTYVQSYGGYAPGFTDGAITPNTIGTGESITQKMYLAHTRSLWKKDFGDATFWQLGPYPAPEYAPFTNWKSVACDGTIYL